MQTRVILAVIKIKKCAFDLFTVKFSENILMIIRLFPHKPLSYTLFLSTEVSIVLEKIKLKYFSPSGQVTLE